VLVARGCFFSHTVLQPCIRVFPHISDIAAANPGRVKVVGINVENIFNNATDVDIRAFVANQSAMNYPVAVDVTGKALEDLVTPSGRLAIPTGQFVMNTLLLLSDKARLLQLY
jgi:thiol-disulfide isomerase/thioredoxin